MEILGALFFNILEITLAMSAIIIAVLIFSRFFGSLFMSRCRYVVWILVALRLLIPFNINIPDPLSLDDVAVEAVVDDSQTVGVPLSNVVTVEPTQHDSQTVSIPSGNASPLPRRSTEDRPSVSLMSIAALVWICVAALSFSVTIISYLRLMYALGSHSRLTPEHSFDRLNILRSEMKLRGTLRVYVSDVATSPMLCGFLRPTVVLPPNELESDQLDAAIAHELIHLRRGDLWVKLLMSAALALHWFNPFVHLMVRYASLDIEFSCDEEALRGSSDETRRVYADALLTFIRSESSRKLPLTTQFDTRKKPIIRRFDRILNNRSRMPGTLLTMIVAVLVITLASCISIGSPRRYGELPDARYYISNGIIYTADGYTKLDKVADAFEYSRGRYERLEPITEAVTLTIDGSDVELVCTYYVASSGNVLRASNNFGSVSYPMGFPFDTIQKPSLVGSRVENLAIVYRDDGVIRTCRIADGVNIAPDGSSETDGNVECMPTDFSPDGTMMLYVSGDNLDFGLWLYDFTTGESQLISERVFPFPTPEPIETDVYNARFEFMDDTTLLIIPATASSGISLPGYEHLGYIYDLEGDAATPLTEYADIPAERYLFIPNSPYMLHVYDHNIMLNNTQSATWLKPAIPSDRFTSIWSSAELLAPSGDHFWFTDESDTFYRVTVHGEDYGDVTYLHYDRPSDVENIHPVGMISDSILLVCERFGDGSYRTIELDFGDGLSDPFEGNESADMSTPAPETTPILPEASTASDTEVTTAQIPKSTTRRMPEPAADIEAELRELEPSMLPSSAETKGAFATAVKVRDDGTIVVEGDREVERFVAKMAEGRPSEWHIIVYRTRELGGSTYYVSDLWYDICYDGDHAYYMSYTYTADEVNNTFDLNVTGPHVFSSIESLYCYDSVGHLYHDFYFNMASDKRLHQPIVRYPITAEDVDIDKAQPIFPDEGGYPLEWFATHTQPQWLEYGLIPANVAGFLRELSEDETVDESRRQLAQRLYDETVSFMRRRTYKEYWATHIDGTNNAGDWDEHKWKDLQQ